MIRSRPCHADRDRNAPVAEDETGLSEKEVNTVIARLELRKSLSGDFVSARHAAEVGKNIPILKRNASASATRSCFDNMRIIQAWLADISALSEGNLGEPNFKPLAKTRWVARGWGITGQPARGPLSALCESIVALRGARNDVGR